MFLFPILQALIIKIPPPPPPPPPVLETVDGSPSDIHISCEQPCRVRYVMNEDETRLEIVVESDWVGFFIIPED